MAKEDNAHFNEKWDDAMIYQIAADKAQGMTIKQLAAKYKMTQQQVKYVVYRRLKNENIERGLAITNVALKEAGVADAKPKNGECNHHGD
jgi:replication initiation and membrane attachment protein DnaB